VRAINDEVARSFAKNNGVPVIKWPLEICATEFSIMSREAMAEALSRCEYCQVFVQGAPAIIEHNYSPSCGAANGSTATFVSLTGVSTEDELAINATPPGEEVMLQQAPEFINVHVDRLDDQRYSEIPHIVSCEKKCLPIPIIPTSIQVGKIEVPVKKHEVQIAFAMTIHKVQGKTLRSVVVLHDARKGSISFEQLFVSCSRVEFAETSASFPPETKKPPPRN